MNDNIASKRHVKIFLSKELTGVISTINVKGDPQSALVYYVADDEFNIYFTTYSNSRKYTNILAHNKVAFVVSNIESPQTVQIEGVAQDVGIIGTSHEIFTQLIEVMSSNQLFLAPVDHIQKERTVLIKITPTMIRLGDFTILSIDGSHEEVFKLLM